MPRSRSLALVLAAVAFAAVPAADLATPASAQTDDALTRDLDAITTSPALAGADVGLVVRHADTGALVYSRESDERGQPASNGKLISSATALDILGPDHRFRTTVAATGPHRAGVLAGDLHLRGTGDPTMLAADYDALAARVAASGVEVVRGKLVADDTWFDAVRLGTGWAWDDEPYYYNAQISALTVSPDTDYDAGSIIVRVAPGAAGQPATVTTEPPTDYVTIANTAVTGPPGSASSVSVERQHGTNVIAVRGSVPAGGAAAREWSTVWEPTGLVTSLFRDALARHGVRVLGGTGTGTTPAGARVLGEHLSMPLSELLVPFMKLSNNMHAEILVKTVGRAVSGEGSWTAGLRAMTAKLGEWGVDPSAVSLRDGSGLSRMDQVSPDQLAALLLAARREPWFATWHDSLPVAGAADRMVGGTLRNRMRGTPAEGNVRAKTGSLTGVSALSGYVTTADGVPLVFAMISNDTLTSAKPFEDAVAIRLAGHARGQAPLAVGVAPEPAPDRGVECSWTKSC
ncbi:D-alanyl-D-alanine carboxypeptidase/D-alanyl-D-alanine-endopeptidase (penicillin-binding protein 4) [Saccharothrix saharensis]|uniref:D-alanyl-D-alanine carboxypeptidase/D-alanyl-D-alanine-endopeptidase (Penicillin-binding protein 4) n=1 Tax=Saccharothrix saharensis TaxID=571190 RepID=A0A543JQJ6_9PSEU|nr:D-alanyl-D-alanine carboxypeptidase/D-alanyl-D-alanine-endopeptidase [Saccharothrix saharensis]TQM85117.1 D-alanyl-D-alanine carboxypeptidase/D-alanyl-D-alanine-endopeptidase (penicillin-binding protein 4) [Saccharothrix saharensis]